MDECIHHWMVEDVHGQVSRAICKLCGKKKRLYNWMAMREIRRGGTKSKRTLEAEAEWGDGPV